MKSVQIITIWGNRCEITAIEYFEGKLIVNLSSWYDWGVCEVYLDFHPLLIPIDQSSIKLHEVLVYVAVWNNFKLHYVFKT